MFFALILTCLIVAGGAFVTCFYDDDAPLLPRLAMGAGTGLAAWGLAGFTLASVMGLTPVTVILATLLVLAAPVYLWTRDAPRRAMVQAEGRAAWWRVTHPTRRDGLYGVYGALMTLLLWRICDRAVITPNGGLGTGVQNNFGDLPFHLSVVTGFAYGQNYPPMDPTFAGLKFTYPFITDFISAMYLTVGADFASSFFVENFVLALALVILLHHWTRVLTGNRHAGLLAPLLVLFSGGLGWITLLRQASDSNKGLFGLLWDLPQKYTIGEDILRWGNSVTTLLVPQRGFLLGLPLALTVFTLLWKLTKEPAGEAAHSDAPEDVAEVVSIPEVAPKPKTKKKKTALSTATRPAWADVPRPMVSQGAIAAGAGVAAALLPLVHAHTYVVVMVVSGLIALIFGWRKWRVWAVFFAVAVLAAAPQMLWATHGSSVAAKSFYALQIGWDKPAEVGLVWFWFKNTGFFIPLTIAACVWQSDGKPLVPRRLLYFLLPFMVCFVAGNVFKMAPWIWDNIKVLFYWWVGSVPLVALLLAHLWQKRDLAWRGGAVLLFCVVTAAGAADVWAVVNGYTNVGIFDRAGLAFAETVRAKTPPRALIVHAPTHLTPVFLTGRQSLMGYPGHIWSHGIAPDQRESDVNSIYAGGSNADALLRQYGVQYAVVGPHERGLNSFNDGFWARYPLVIDMGEYKLYQVR